MFASKYYEYVKAEHTLAICALTVEYAQDWIPMRADKE